MGDPLKEFREGMIRAGYLAEDVSQEAFNEKMFDPEIRKQIRQQLVSSGDLSEDVTQDIFDAKFGFDSEVDFEPFPAEKTPPKPNLIDDVNSQEIESISQLDEELNTLKDRFDRGVVSELQTEGFGDKQKVVERERAATNEELAANLDRERELSDMQDKLLSPGSYDVITSEEWSKRFEDRDPVTKYEQAKKAVEKNTQLMQEAASHYAKRFQDSNGISLIEQVSSVGGGLEEMEPQMRQISAQIESSNVRFRKLEQEAQTIQAQEFTTQEQVDAANLRLQEISAEIQGIQEEQTNLQQNPIIQQYQSLIAEQQRLSEDTDVQNWFALQNKIQDQTEQYKKDFPRDAAIQEAFVERQKEVDASGMGTARASWKNIRSGSRTGWWKSPYVVYDSILDFVEDKTGFRPAFTLTGMVQSLVRRQMGKIAPEAMEQVKLSEHLSDKEYWAQIDLKDVMPSSLQGTVVERVVDIKGSNYKAVVDSDGKVTKVRSKSNEKVIPFDQLPQDVLNTIQDISQNPSKYDTEWDGDIERALTNTAQTLAAMAPLVAGGMMTGGAGGAFMVSFLSMYGDYYEEGLREFADVDKALAYGIFTTGLVSTVEAAVGAVEPFAGKNVRQLLGGKTAKSFDDFINAPNKSQAFSSAVKSGAKEVLKEFPEEALSMLAESAANKISGLDSEISAEEWIEGGLMSISAGGSVAAVGSVANYMNVRSTMADGMVAASKHLDVFKEAIEKSKLSDQEKIAKVAAAESLNLKRSEYEKLGYTKDQVNKLIALEAEKETNNLYYGDSTNEKLTKRKEEANAKLDERIKKLIDEAESQIEEEPMDTTDEDVDDDALDSEEIKRSPYYLKKIVDPDQPVSVTEEGSEGVPSQETPEDVDTGENLAEEEPSTPQENQKIQYKKSDGKTIELTYTEEKGWVNDKGRKQNSAVQEKANQQFSNEQIRTDEKARDDSQPEQPNTPSVDDSGLPQDSQVTEEGQESSQEQAQLDEEPILSTKTDKDELQETKEDADEVRQGRESEDDSQEKVVQEEIDRDIRRIGEIEGQLLAELSSLQEEVNNSDVDFSESTGGIFNVLDADIDLNNKKSVAKAFGKIGRLTKKQKDAFGEKRLNDLKELHKEWKQLSANNTPTARRKRLEAAKISAKEHQTSTQNERKDSTDNKREDKKKSTKKSETKGKTNTEIRKEAWANISSILNEGIGIAYDPKKAAEDNIKIIKELVKIAETYLDDGYLKFRQMVRKNAPDIPTKLVRSAFKKAKGYVEPVKGDIHKLDNGVYEYDGNQWNLIGGKRRRNHTQELIQQDFGQSLIDYAAPRNVQQLESALQLTFGFPPKIAKMQAALMDRMIMSTIKGKRDKASKEKAYREHINLLVSPPNIEQFREQTGQQGSENIRFDSSANEKTYSIGLTPYASNRIPKYSSINDIINDPTSSVEQINAAISEMQQDLEYRLSRVLPKNSYEVVQNKGVWGETEISFEIKLNLPIEDVIFVASKLGSEFDQDAVHVRDFGFEISEKDVVGRIKEDGSAVVPYAFLEFNRSLTDSEFYSILQEVGLYGGTLSADGKSALLYNAETFEDTEDVLRQESQEKFSNSIEKLINYDSKGVATVRSKVGETKLWELVRGNSEKVRGTYEWGTSKFYPKTSTETRRQLEKDRDKTEWARFSLKRKIADAIRKVSGLFPKIKSDHKDMLTAIGVSFDRMILYDDSPEVFQAYEALLDVINTQYSELPIKVYPHGTAKAVYDENGQIVFNEDGTVKVEWTPNAEDTAYDGSGEMIHDVDENNQMVFYATGKDSFGNSNVDYSNHPLLRKSKFKTTGIPIKDNNGNILKINGDVALYRLPMLYNDVFRVVHDYYAHAASGATFGARGEERAWAAHVASIISDSRFNDDIRLKAIRALTSETRGQNTWVNLVNEKNKKLNDLFDDRRKALKSGKDVSDINEKIDELGGIEFADQKTGLLPTDTLIGGYAETADSDNWIKSKLTGSEYVSPQTVSSISAERAPNIPQVEEYQRRVNKGKLKDPLKEHNRRNKIYYDIMYKNEKNPTLKEFYKTYRDLADQGVLFDAPPQIPIGPSFISNAKIAIKGIKDKNPKTPSQWVKMLSDVQKNGGIRKVNQELDWIGLEGYLNEWVEQNNAKSVPKEVVEQYINDNQIEIIEVQKGKRLINEERLQEIESLLGAEGYSLELDMGGEGYMLIKDGELVDYDAAPEHIQELWEEYNSSSSSDFNSNSTIEGKYSEYTLEGGENYREVLLILPEKRQPILKKVVEENGKFYVEGLIFPFNTKKDAEEYIEKHFKGKERLTDNYKSSHWDESNILAHVRLNERTLPNGERVLFIEEIQSDWAQEGKKKGFENKATKEDFVLIESKKLDGRETTAWTFLNKKTNLKNIEVAKTEAEAFNVAVENYNKMARLTPDMPYKKTDQWVGMAMRRVMQMAAQEGFDRVAWVTGEQSADRYDLSQQVKYIERIPKNKRDVYVDISTSSKMVNLVVNSETGEIIDQQGSTTFGDIEGKSLEDVIGKEMSQKVLAEKTRQRFKGERLKVGGEGMKAFYNSILPKVAKKEAQRFDKNAKVEVVDFGDSRIEKRGGRYRVFDDNGDPNWFENENEAETFAKGLKLPNDSKTPSKQLSIQITDKIKENTKSVPLFDAPSQSLPPRGAYDISTRIMYALFNPTVTTPIHELAHAREKFLSPEQKQSVLDWVSSLNGKDYSDQNVNDEDYVFPMEVSEFFARGSEQYLKDGEAEGFKLTDAVREIFDQFKQWLKDIAIVVDGVNLSGKLNPAMKEIYAEMFDLEAVGSSRPKKAKAKSSAGKVQQETPTEKTIKQERKEKAKTRYIQRIEQDPNIDEEYKKVLQGEGELGNRVPNRVAKDRALYYTADIDSMSVEDIEALFDLVTSDAIGQVPYHFLVAQIIANEYKRRRLFKKAAEAERWIAIKAQDYGRLIQTLGGLAGDPDIGIPATLAAMHAERSAHMKKEMVDGSKMTYQQDLEALFGDGVTEQMVKEALAQYNEKGATPKIKIEDVAPEVKAVTATALVNEGKKELKAGLKRLSNALRKGAGAGPQLTGEVLSALVDIAKAAIKTASGRIKQAKEVFDNAVKGTGFEGKFDEVVKKGKIDVEVERKAFAAKTIAERLRDKKPKNTKKDSIDHLVDAIASLKTRSRSPKNTTKKDPISELVKQAEQGDVKLELLERARVEAEDLLKSGKRSAEETAQILNDIDDIIADLKGSPFKQSDIRKAFREGLRDINKTINDIVTDIHVKGMVVDSIAAEVIRRTGVDEKTAKKYERVIKKVVDQYLAPILAEKVRENAEKQQRKLEQAKRKAQKKYEEEIEKREKEAREAINDIQRRKALNAIAAAEQKRKEEKRAFDREISRLKRSTASPNNLQQILQKLQEGLANGYLSDRDFMYLFGDRYGVSDVKTEQLEKLKDLSNKIKNTKSPLLKKRLLEQLNDELSKLKETSIAQSIMSFMLSTAYINMLSGPLTVERATSGHLGALAYSMAADFLATAASVLTDISKGNFDSAKFTSYIYGQAFRYGVQNFYKVGFFDWFDAMMGATPSQSLLDGDQKIINQEYNNRITRDISNKFLGSIKRQIKNWDTLESRTLQKAFDTALGQKVKVGKHIFKIGEILYSSIMSPFVTLVRGISAYDILVGSFSVPYHETMGALDKAKEADLKEAATHADYVAELRRILGKQYESDFKELSKLEADELGLTGRARTKFIQQSTRAYVQDAMDADVKEAASHLSKNISLMAAPSGVVGAALQKGMFSNARLQINPDDDYGVITLKYALNILKTGLIPFGKVAYNFMNFGITHTYLTFVLDIVNKAMNRSNQVYRLNENTGKYEWIEMTPLERRRRTTAGIVSILATVGLFLHMFEIEDEGDELRIVPRKDALIRVTFDGHPAYADTKSIERSYDTFALQFRNSPEDEWKTLVGDYRVIPGIGHILAPLGAVYEKYYLEDDRYVDKGVVLQKGNYVASTAQILSTITVSGLAFSLSQGFVSGIETAQDLMEIVLTTTDFGEENRFDYLADKTARTFAGQYTKPALIRYTTQQLKAFKNEPFKDYSSLTEYIMKDNLLDHLLTDEKIDGLGELVYPEVDLPFTPSAWTKGIDEGNEEARNRSKMHDLIMSNPELLKPGNYWMKPLKDTGVKYIPKAMQYDIKREVAELTGEIVNENFDVLASKSSKELNKELDKIRTQAASTIKGLAMNKYLRDNGVNIPEKDISWTKVRAFIVANDIEIKKVIGGNVIIKKNPSKRHYTKDAQYLGTPTGDELDKLVSSQFGAGNIASEEEISNLPQETRDILNNIKSVKKSVGDYEVDTYTFEDTDVTYYEIPAKVGRSLTKSAQDKFLKSIPKYAGIVNNDAPYKQAEKVGKLHKEFVEQEEALYLIEKLIDNKEIRKTDVINFYIIKKDQKLFKRHPNSKRFTEGRESKYGLPDLYKIRKYMRDENIMLTEDGKIIKLD